MPLILSLLKQFWWIPVAAGLYFYGDYHGTEAQKRIHSAYVTARDLAEAKAVQQALDAADAKYARQLKDIHDVMDQYAKDAEANAAARDAALVRVRDYQDLLRARSVQGPATASGNPGPQVVRFNLEDYSRFTDTALSVAKNGQDDAIALKACRAALEIH